MSERRELYRSPNGDSWFLGREPTTGHAFIIHQPNAPSGGRLSHVEAWAAKLRDTPSRSEAIRRLIELGLASVRRPKPTDQKAAAKAAGLAGAMVDHLSDDSIPADIREKRKRRLVTDSSEFREMRIYRR